MLLLIELMLLRNKFKLLLELSEMGCIVTRYWINSDGTSNRDENQQSGVEKDEYYGKFASPQLSSVTHHL